jgi:hypothetical protein
MAHRHARFALFALWCVGSSVSLVIVLMQSMTGRYGNDVLHAWAWLLASVLPTLTFMATMLIALDESEHTARAKPGLFGWAFVLSTGYLLLVAVTLFAQPFIAMDPIQLFATSQLWLAPSQSLALVFVTVYFVKA